jgi:alpha-D-ribose 1-methylphosphonate 5-triphosphate diphosphatase PhnM
MTKKRTAKKSAPATKKRAEQCHEEQIVLDPEQDKALRLVDRSAKIRAELEGAVTTAAAKAVRKVMKDHGIALNPAQTSVLTTIMFGE